VCREREGGEKIDVKTVVSLEDGRNDWPEALGFSVLSLGFDLGGRAGKVGFSMGGTEMPFGAVRVKR
jgi:hypothetical protein